MPAEQLVRTLLYGETTGFWIQTGAFFLSAVGAIYVIRANAKQARNRATIDLIFQQKHDATLIAARKTVSDIHNKKEDNLSRYLQDRDSEQCKAIQEVLNSYEFIASGIREGAFDEKIYKRIRYSLVMKDWAALKGAIYEIRRIVNSETTFQEFEWMCSRWQESPLTTKPPSAWRKIFSW